MNIAVIGDGGWGSAAAKLLDSYGHTVTVWGPFPEYIAEVRKTLTNPRYLPGIKFAPSIHWTSALASAVPDADAVVLAVPSKFYRSICEQIAPLLDVKHTLVISLTKGVCPETHQRMSEVARETLKTDRVVVLSGPSHAEEVARGIPTSVVVASDSAITAQIVQSIMSGDNLRIYTSDDLIGVELGGALKNVIAIAAGFCDGLGLGDNTKAALITRGLAEIARLGVCMGAKEYTFSGLA